MSKSCVSEKPYALEQHSQTSRVWILQQQAGRYYEEKRLANEIRLFITGSSPKWVIVGISTKSSCQGYSFVVERTKHSNGYLTGTANMNS